MDITTLLRMKEKYGHTITKEKDTAPFAVESYGDQIVLLGKKAEELRVDANKILAEVTTLETERDRLIVRSLLDEAKEKINANELVSENPKIDFELLKYKEHREGNHKSLDERIGYHDTENWFEINPRAGVRHDVLVDLVISKGIYPESHIIQHKFDRTEVYYDRDVNEDIRRIEKKEDPSYRRRLEKSELEKVWAEETELWKGIGASTEIYFSCGAKYLSISKKIDKKRLAQFMDILLTPEVLVLPREGEYLGYISRGVHML